MFDTPAKLEALRAEMRKAKLHAYLVPGTDPHQSEYVPACFDRRSWLSGFSGSAGEAVVTLTGAALWTDGRYFLQAERELAGSGIELMRQGQPGVPTVAQYVTDCLSAGQNLGADPRLISMARAAELSRSLAESGQSLVCPDHNLVDAIWPQRPPVPAEPVKALATRFAGERISAKLKRVHAAVESAGASTLVVTALDAIAWLFNIRGADVNFNPVSIAYALVDEKGATLFIDQEKVSGAVRRHLGNRVAIEPYQGFARALNRCAGPVMVDEASASHWVGQALGDTPTVCGDSPIMAMKAVKNEVELAGMRAAHVRDGVAMVKFLCWLEEAVPAGGVSEISAARQLAAFRAEGEHFQGLSFRTISGYADHGAIIHYTVTEQTDVPLRSRGLYLVDSGAQYLDGTTDITRTIALGKRVGRHERDAYTRVLKGHIALAEARFPPGTTGARLDTLARQHLWQGGLDYNHGTGHGVGAYLNVHEGPQSISPRGTAAPLEPGNIQSNEPGYYEPDRFGVRIENLVEVVERPTRADGRPTLGFNTLTLCPIDTRPIERRLLRADEIAWLNAYHKRVRITLSPYLGANERRWLRTACAAL